jgi:hypothetical protein
MALTQVVGGLIAPSTTLTTPIVATTMGVGGATPSGSGSGITFPATQSASSDANTLDDYEEGTFTPTAAGTSTAGTGTYSSQLGRYTKIGRLTYFTITLAWSAHTGTGGISIRGLPFSQWSPSGERYSYNIVAETLTYSGQLVTLNDGSTAFALLQQSSNSYLSEVAMDTSVNYLVITGTYNV